jgi:hypothetical protein
MSQSRVATRLSDAVMNITLLQFETEEDAGDERGKDFVGLHHFGILVDDIDSMKSSIEVHGGKFHPATPRPMPNISSETRTASSSISRLMDGTALGAEISRRAN